MCRFHGSGKRPRCLLLIEMPNKFPVPTNLTRSASAEINPGNRPNSDAFLSCYERFQQCLEFADSAATSSLLEAASSFVLDFDVVARRTLGADTARYRLFRLHFLQEHTRQSCCEKLQLTHWTFASEVRAIEQVLSVAMTDAGLFPLAPYFTPSVVRPERLAA